MLFYFFFFFSLFFNFFKFGDRIATNRILYYSPIYVFPSKMIKKGGLFTPPPTVMPLLTGLLSYVNMGRLSLSRFMKHFMTEWTHSRISDLEVVARTQMRDRAILTLLSPPVLGPSASPFSVGKLLIQKQKIFSADLWVPVLDEITQSFFANVLIFGYSIPKGNPLHCYYIYFFVLGQVWRSTPVRIRNFYFLFILKRINMQSYFHIIVSMCIGSIEFN